MRGENKTKTPLKEVKKSLILQADHMGRSMKKRKCCN